MEEPLPAKGRGRGRARGRGRGQGKAQPAKGRGRKKGDDDKGGEVDMATRAKKAQDEVATAYIDILENKSPEKIANAWAAINGNFEHMNNINCFFCIAIAKDSKLQKYPEWIGMEINAYANVRDWVWSIKMCYSNVDLNCFGFRSFNTTNVGNRWSKQRYTVILLFVQVITVCWLSENGSMRL